MNIGVAGYMGAGKSTLTHFLADGSGVIINADIEAKRMMNKRDDLKVALAKAFGDAVISDGAVSFELLGQKAFVSADSLATLNAIIHPPLLELLHKQMSDVNADIVIVDAALISYWKIEHWFNELIWVKAPTDLRLQRLGKRYALPVAEIERRMRMQTDLFAEPKGLPWTIISNAGEVDALRNFWKKYC